MNQLSLLYVVLIYSIIFIDSVNGSCPEITIFFNNKSVNASPISPIARDCKEWFDSGVKKSGVYPVNPDGKNAFQVYCDMETDGGGWTVFQRRKDGSVIFYRNWVDYENGFGDLTGEFWLGLSKMYRIMLLGLGKQSAIAGFQPANTLRIHLQYFNGKIYYAKYNQFAIGDSKAKYPITIIGYSGNAGDSLSWHNGAKFSTKDQDNDIWKDSCASLYKGAWWFKNCHYSNLNGIYHTGPIDNQRNGIQWYNLGSKTSLKSSTMMFRRDM